MRRLPHDKFERWAATRTVFLSSEMRELEGLRRTVGDALRAAGFTVVMFEDLGGRDEDAERAYLDGVARGDLYVGVIANRYGTMLASGRSPTHEEYREARRLGRRISVWVDRDDSQRQGNAADFVQELQTFHTTGQFANANDLVTRLLQRLSEIAADDEAPWVKLGDVCLRAQTIEDRGSTIRVKAEVRDTTAVDALERYRPGQIRRAEPIPISTARRSGLGRVTEVVTKTLSTSIFEVQLSAEIEWGSGTAGSSEMTFGGLSPDDQTEIGLRAGLLREPLPSQAEGHFGFAFDTSDPFAAIDGLPLVPAAEEAMISLLLAERILGSGRASRITRFGLGPPRPDGRTIALQYIEPRRYANREPGVRTIEGQRPARA